MCMWFGFNPAINFCHFSTLLTLSVCAGATSNSPKFYLFSAKRFDVNLDDRSRTEHFLDGNVNVFALKYAYLSLNAIVEGNIC